MISERDMFACNMRKNGDAYARIGRYLGVSTGRANKIVKQAQRRIDEDNANEKPWTYGLSVRSKNILLINGFKCQQDIIEFFKSGGNMAKLPDCGPVTEKEVMAWMGMDKKQKKGRKKASQESIDRAIAFLQRYGYEVNKK